MSTNEPKNKEPTKEKQGVTFDAEISASLVKQDDKIKTTTKLVGKTVDLLVLTYVVIANFAEQTGLPEEVVLTTLKKVGSQLEKDTTEKEKSDEEKFKALLKDFLNFFISDKKGE